MTFCSNDIQRKNLTANMYVAEELWSLCCAHVFITVANITRTAYKIITKCRKKYAKPKEVSRMERIITECK